MPVHPLGDLRPALGRDVFVAPSASVIGDVVVGDESSLWFGVVVRGDVFPIRIGARTNIQDNSVVHVTGGRSATTIGDDVTVGHAVIVHGCTIGHRCLVGMGSLVLDDAVIEDECFVAAGSLVPPRMVVPARSFVMGRPAKVIRPVKDDELVQIREASRHYVDNARRFARDLG
ncbi:MAG: gamma carbonic anhydrase family protein [Deltaproteobacteria bacterium]|nr:gamma carbonic anhydrase family protein [Deltaproteobacteria bacterium]